MDDTAAANGIALACQLFPTTDLHVSPLGQRRPTTDLNKENP